MTQLNKFISSVFVLIVLSVAPLEGSGQEDTPAATAPEVKKLEDGRFKIGNITVDKAKRSFTLGGRVLHLVQPLEYLAVSLEGIKAYESLLELDATAIEFQLACILIGLDDQKSTKPAFQFDEGPVEGQPVNINLSWPAENGDVKSVSASNALMAGDKPFDDHAWVYIGSSTAPDGSLMAESVGTLIGFVHDPMSIIEHRNGAGIGAYGSITGNAAMLPAEGSSVTMTVSVIEESSKH